MNRYRQAQKVGASECANEWRNVAEAAGVPPARLAVPNVMECSHKTSVAAIQRQNKKEDQRHSKKIIQLTEQEIIDHKNFIKKELKKNFY